MRLDYYKSASILFSEAEGDTLLRDNRITYIGRSRDSTGIGEASYGTEHYLNCTIFCTPALRQGYSLELEGTTSADYFRNRRHGGLPEPQPVPRRRTVRHQGARRLRIHARQTEAQLVRIRRIDIVFVSPFHHAAANRPLQPSLQSADESRSLLQRTAPPVLPSYAGQRRLGLYVGQRQKQHLRPAAGGHQRGETAADRHGFPRTIAESLPAEQLRIAGDRRTVRLVYLQQPEDQHRTQFAGVTVQFRNER